MVAKQKKHNVKDESGLIDRLVDELQKRGIVRLVHFGRFKVIVVKGRKVYSWKKRAMVPVKPFKQVVFSPSKGLRDMLNKKARDG